MLDAWVAGIEGLLQVKELMFLSLGMGIGLVFGALPGLGGATALALLMPLTYGLEPFTAVALAGGVMGAVPMGGSLTAILLNAPGSAPNAATCLDGYPLAQQGKAGYAIGAAATANSLGGIIGTVSVLAVLPVAKQLVLLFGPPEFFLLSILALVTVAASLSGRMLRGLLTGGIGLMIATIGYDSVTGTTRFAGGIEYLWDGVHLVPALIGLFAVAEMINLSVTGGTVAKDLRSVKITSMMSGVKATFQHWRTVLRGSIIGTLVGAIPGEGGTVAAFLSYSMTVQASDDPDSFGKGNIQGVIAPEAAINAKDGSALIPTIAFGIPSGAEMAVFLGILVLHGMQPGPLMLAQNQNEIYGLVWALTGACILASIIGVLLARPLGLITLVDSRIFVPIIIAVAMTGSYAVDRSIENPILTLAFGILGYVMIRHDYPRLTIVIALVLGATAERNFHQSMMIGDGSWSIFTSRWMCWVLIAAIVVFLTLPPLRARLFPPRKRKAAAEAGMVCFLARAFGTELSEYLPAAGAAAVAALYLGAAYQYSPEARATPLLIGWSVIALAVLDIASRTQTRLGHTLSAWLNPVTTQMRHGAGSTAYPIGRQVMAIAWIAGFVAAFALIGATYAIPIYVFAATRWRGGRPYLVCLISAACTLAGIWFLFGWLLRLELYPGLLFGGG